MSLEEKIEGMERRLKALEGLHGADLGRFPLKEKSGEKEGDGLRPQGRSAIWADMRFSEECHEWVVHIHHPAGFDTVYCPLEVNAMEIVRRINLANGEGAPTEPPSPPSPSKPREWKIKGHGSVNLIYTGPYIEFNETIPVREDTPHDAEVRAWAGEMAKWVRRRVGDDEFHVLKEKARALGLLEEGK